MEYSNTLLVSLTLVFNCLIVRVSRAAVMKEIHFQLDASCPGRVLNSIHCPQVLQMAGMLQCSSQCFQRPDCYSIKWDSNLSTCHLCLDAPMLDCANTHDSSLKAYRMTVTPDSCQNGGSYSSSVQRCLCPAGFAGLWCQRRMYDCREGLSLGYPQAVYEIQPALAPQPFPAFCQMVNMGRTYLLQRNTDNTVSFSRTWLDYRNGFGDLASNGWLGLQNLYYLSNSGLSYILKVEPRVPNNTYYQQYYKGFRVTEESDHYRMYFDSTYGNSARPAGDALSSSLGAPFSTYDTDNDGDATVNCAERHQVGWWFPEGDCNLTKCNPLGKSTTVWTANPVDIFWSGAILENLPITKIVMWMDRI